MTIISADLFSWLIRTPPLTPSPTATIHVLGFGVPIPANDPSDHRCPRSGGCAYARRWSNGPCFVMSLLHCDYHLVPFDRPCPVGADRPCGDLFQNPRAPTPLVVLIWDGVFAYGILRSSGAWPYGASPNVVLEQRNPKRPLYLYLDGCCLCCWSGRCGKACPMALTFDWRWRVMLFAGTVIYAHPGNAFSRMQLAPALC